MSQEAVKKQEQVRLLKELIQSNPEPKVLKRALAVKLVLEGYAYRVIKEIIGVSYGFISKWKKIFERQGIEGLNSQYLGAKSYLNLGQRQAVIAWLIEQKSWDISELEVHLIEQYDVVFKSKQSYYDILKEARLSWQKGEQVNPRQDLELISKKNSELASILEKHRSEIESQELAVYIIDECHVHWQDICGYLWNFIKNPLKIAIANPRQRQTYYGALNLFTKEFVLLPYQQGNGENTVDFVKRLKLKNPKAKVWLIWDGASYHRGAEMKKFLAQQNDGLPPEEWKISCYLFAPYAPEENPVEAIWLQLKTLLRRCYRFGQNFQIVKRLFQLFVDLKLFNVPNLKNYVAFSQFI